MGEERRRPEPPEPDHFERRVRFVLGVVIVATMFGYVLAAAFTQGTARPLALPDWKYAIPFVLVAFVVVFQLDMRDVRALLRLFLGGIASASKEDDDAER